MIIQRDDPQCPQLLKPFCMISGFDLQQSYNLIIHRAPNGFTTLSLDGHVHLLFHRAVDRFVQHTMYEIAATESYLLAC